MRRAVRPLMLQLRFDERDGRVADREQRGAIVHAVIQRLVLVDPTRQAELIRRIAEGLLPDLAQSPDAAGCQLVAGDDGDALVCIALFGDQASAAVGATLVEAWMRRYVAPLIVEGPEVVLGEVIRP